MTAPPLPITAVATPIRPQATLLTYIVAIIVIIGRVRPRVRPVLPAVRPKMTLALAAQIAAHPAAPAARNRGVVLVGAITAVVVVARGAPRAAPQRDPPARDVRKAALQLLARGSPAEVLLLVRAVGQGGTRGRVPMLSDQRRVLLRGLEAQMGLRSERAARQA